VTPAGFEPATPRLGIWCSIQLSYGAVGCGDAQARYCRRPIEAIKVFAGERQKKARPEPGWKRKRMRNYNAVARILRAAPILGSTLNTVNGQTLLARSKLCSRCRLR
jgi:hypothetical protein